MRRIGLALVAFTVMTCFTWAQDVPKHFQDMATTIGKPGTFNADGSFRINIPRTDVKFYNTSGMLIPPDLGLVTYIALSGTADKVLAIGDVAMLDGEIDGVMDRLRAGGFELVSLHNHMTSELPRLFYMHFQIVGSPDAIAKTFRSAVDVLGHGAKAAKVQNVGKPKLDGDALGQVFGSKPQVFPSGVLRFNNPRKDISVEVQGEQVLPGMGLASWAAFNACECGKTMVMGDTCCEPGELQSVIDALRKASIHITAIHNHLLGASHDTMFLHYDGEGDALNMAAGIRAAWDSLGKSK